MRKTLQALAATASLTMLPVASWALGSNATLPLNQLERLALDPSREMIEQGRSVAESNCARCHGMDGASTEPGMPNLAGQRTVYLYRVLHAYQERDRKNDTMNHAAGFLNDDALMAAAAYYANLPPIALDISPEQAAAAAGSGDAFAGVRNDMKKCVRCHGEDGNSSASGMPNLTAQAPEYFVMAMKAYTEDGRNHRMMKKFVADLDEATLEQMGVFYAVQRPLRTETVGDGSAEAGAALVEDCANCHGADGNASGAEMPSLAGQDARYFIKAMEAYREGERQHEAMFEAADKLSEADIADLAAFYAAQEPVRRNVRAPLTTTEWIDRCERCHGLDGNSTDPRFPMLAGQDEAYLRKAMKSYTAGTNGDSTMHAMAQPLSETDVERIVAHYARQQPKSVIYMHLPCEAPTDF